MAVFDLLTLGLQNRQKIAQGVTALGNTLRTKTLTTLPKPTYNLEAIKAKAAATGGKITPEEAAFYNKSMPKPQQSFLSVDRGGVTPPKPSLFGAITSGVDKLLSKKSFNPETALPNIADQAGGELQTRVDKVLEPYKSSILVVGKELQTRVDKVLEPYKPSILAAGKELQTRVQDRILAEPEGTFKNNPITRALGGAVTSIGQGLEDISGGETKQSPRYISGLTKVVFGGLGLAVPQVAAFNIASEAPVTGDIIKPALQKVDEVNNFVFDKLNIPQGELRDLLNTAAQIAEFALLHKAIKSGGGGLKEKLTTETVKYTPEQTLKAYAEITSGVADPSVPQTLRTKTKELFDNASKGVEQKAMLRDSYKTGITIKQARDFTQWFNKFFNNVKTNATTPEFAGLLRSGKEALLNKVDPIEFTKQAREIMLKTDSIADLRKFAQLKGGKVGTPGVDFPAPLPEKPMSRVDAALAAHEQVILDSVKGGVQLAENIGFDKPDIKLFNQVKRLSESKAGQAGDIVTMQKTNPNLINNAIERFREVKGDEVVHLDDGQVLEEILKTPNIGELSKAEKVAYKTPNIDISPPEFKDTASKTDISKITADEFNKMSPEQQAKITQEFESLPVAEQERLSAEIEKAATPTSRVDTAVAAKFEDWLSTPEAKGDRSFAANNTNKTPVQKGKSIQTEAQLPTKLETIPAQRIGSFETTPEGELRSIKAQMKQEQGKLSKQQSLLNDSYSSEVSPLDTPLSKIIKQSPTDVKSKVNIIDYLRTPEKILQKIGFADEAIKLRKGYDNYLKELPENLEVITRWHDLIPTKESNVRVFKYLDGEAITLNPTEKKVAMEIKGYLKDWAKRLKLPEDKQVTHYITHLFDNEFLAKEFDEDLAKIISERVPGSVYDPFLQSRLGAKGYKQDTWAALDAYVKRATRKVNMDDALEAIRDKAGGTLEFSNIEESQFKYIKRYIDRVNMRPTEFDNLIDNAVKSIIGYKFGQRPVAQVTALLRRMTSRSALGLNVGSALRNLSQGVNTYAVLGEKYTAIGYAKLFKGGAMNELRAEGVLSNTFIQDRTLSATKKTMQKVDSVLYSFFEQAEKINRGAAYFGAKSKALNMGKSEAEAIEYAKDIVRKTQFAFGSIDTPVGLQGDIVKTLTQFQSYTVKQIEFLTEMAKDKNFVGLVRYAVAGLLFATVVGKMFGMKSQELLPIPRFSSPPSIKFFEETAKAILNTPDKYGQPRSLDQKLSDIFSSIYGYVPASSQIRKTSGTVEALLNSGVVDGASGKTKFSLDTKNTLEVIRALLFGVYNSEQGEIYIKKLNDSTVSAINTIQPIYDKIQKLKDDGKSEDALVIYKGLSDADKKAYQMRKLLPTYSAIQKLKDDGKDAEALALYKTLSKTDQKTYGALKKEMNDDTTNEKSNSVDDRNIFGLGVDYAKAFIIDPENAWKSFTTREELGLVKGNLVEMQRFYGIKYTNKGGSEEYKKQRMEEMGIPWGKRKEYKLEHIVPVKAGGDTSDENLIPINNKEHDFYTPIDILMAKAVQSGKKTRKEISELAKKFKVDKTITAEEVVTALKS